MISKGEFVDLLTEFQGMYDKAKEIAEVMDTDNWWGFEMMSVHYELINKYLALPSDDVLGTSLDYYVWEKYFGKYPWTIDTVTISNWEDLYDYVLEPEWKLGRHISDEEIVERYNSIHGISK